MSEDVARTDHRRSAICANGERRKNFPTGTVCVPSCRMKMTPAPFSTGYPPEAAIPFSRGGTAPLRRDQCRPRPLFGSVTASWACMTLVSFMRSPRAGAALIGCAASGTFTRPQWRVTLPIAPVTFAALAAPGSGRDRGDVAMACAIFVTFTPPAADFRHR